MGGYTASVQWRRGEALFTDNKYSRAHTVSFDAPLTLPASSSPHVIPLPFSRADAVDPEEMLVAALSSCHMLSFLYEARKAGFVVDAYDDAAEAVLAKDEEGRLALTRTTLRPKILWGGENRPSAEEIEHLHHLAHEACFIANSYKGEVIVA